MLLALLQFTLRTIQISQVKQDRRTGAEDIIIALFNGDGFQQSQGFLGITLFAHEPCKDACCIGIMNTYN